MSVRIWLTVIFYLIVKYVEATDNDLEIQEYNGQCIKTVEGLIDAFNTGLNTSHSATHSESDSLLDMSGRRIQTQSLIIIRFNTATSETTSTSLRNNTNSCCHPTQIGCIIIVTARKHILAILQPILLFVLGAPIIRITAGGHYPPPTANLEGMYCWTPPAFCPNVNESEILKDFSASVS